MIILLGKSREKNTELKKLAEYFGVDEGFILGYGQENPNLFVPTNPAISGVSETEQIVQHSLFSVPDRQVFRFQHQRTPPFRLR